jgi:hypothetical protein
MSPAFAPPPSGQLGLGGIMRATIRLYRTAPLPFLIAALVSTLPESILLIGSDLTSGPAGGHVRGLLQRVLPLTPQLLLGQISVAASAVLVMQMFRQQPPRTGRALEIVGERFWPLVGVVVLTTLGIFAGLLALVIPGVILFVWWLFAPITAVTEQLAIGPAISRSRRLVSGRFWWVLGGWLAIQLTVLLGTLVVMDLITIPLDGVHGSAGVVVRGIAAFVALTLATPVANIGVSLIYLELRARDDGQWPEPPHPAGHRDG